MIPGTKDLGITDLPVVSMILWWLLLLWTNHSEGVVDFKGRASCQALIFSKSSRHHRLLRHTSPPPYTPLHSFKCSFPFFCSVPIVHTIEDAVKDASHRRNGAARYVLHLQLPLESTSSTNMYLIAKPATALMPFRAAQTAWISSSSSSKAEPVTQSPGLISTGPSTSLSATKNRQEVVLPSQEGKKGLAQYALCVPKVAWTSKDKEADNWAEPRSIKSRIGLDRVRYGP